MLLQGAQTGGRGRRRRRGGFDHAGGATSLDSIRQGDEVEIVEVADDAARTHALRFGMCAGSRVRCVTRIPAGPVVVESGRQEIAVGRRLAHRIKVRHVRRSDVRK